VKGSNVPGYTATVIRLLRLFQLQARV